MATITATGWMAVVLAAAVYIAACVAAARLAGRGGKARAAWLVISIAATPVPAVLAMILSRRRAGRRPVTGGLRRCPHCQELMDSPAGRRGAVPLCPRCGLAVNEVHLA